MEKIERAKHSISYEVSPDKNQLTNNKHHFVNRAGNSAESLSTSVKITLPCFTISPKSGRHFNNIYIYDNCERENKEDHFSGRDIKTSEKGKNICISAFLSC
ncbi:hypothetical protein ACOSQ3_026090 [Xanthoceras sorbifolium]